MTPKMMMVMHQLFTLMLTVQFMYKMCYIMYLIIIINQNLLLCDHENNTNNNKTEFSLKIVTDCQNSNF